MCARFFVLICSSHFFFSSRRRHTRCALVTGVQTCALPILATYAEWLALSEGALPTLSDDEAVAARTQVAEALAGGHHILDRDTIEALLGGVGMVMVASRACSTADERSEESRVGKAGVSMCRSRWLPCH